MQGSSNGTMATYLYGIARGLQQEPSSLPAVADAEAEIRTIEGDSCVAIVSDAPGSFVDATAEDLQRHSDVLQKLLDCTTALVPLRFGTVCPDDKTVRRDLLGARRDELGALLQKVEDRVEARLKAYYVEGTVLAEIVAEQPQIAKLRQRTQAFPADATYYDRIRLGELVASALEAKRRRDGQEMLARLAPLAVDHVVEEEPHEWSLLTASFLLDRSRLDDFHSAVSGVADAAEQRLRLRCLAPLPPYSFVSLQLAPTEAEAAWAS
jgi:Gas vesicle synthesis protein GvpL/GvpF